MTLQKRGKRWPVVLTAAAAVLAAGPTLAAETLRFHHDLPENSAQHEGAERFKQLVEERSDGYYKVELYPNNALGDDVEVAQQMQFGSVQAAPIPTAKLSNFNPALQLFDLPFLFPSRQVTYEFLDSDVGMRVLAGLRDAGFEPVNVWESGFKQFTCNAPIQSPSDFSGKDVRVMESPLLMAQFEAVDASPVPIAFSETYTALQQGVVDCQENPLVSILNMKFYEVQDHLMLSNHAYLGTAFIYSKMWFDSQPAEMKEVLVQAARDAGAFQRQRAIEREKEYLDEIKGSGETEIIEFTTDQLEQFRTAMRPVHEEFADAIGPDLLRATYEKIDELSK